MAPFINGTNNFDSIPISNISLIYVFDNIVCLNNIVDKRYFRLSKEIYSIYENFIASFCVFVKLCFIEIIHCLVYIIICSCSKMEFVISI